MENSGIDEPQAEPPSGPGALFASWLDPARPRAKLWRTALGVLLILVVWVVWTLLVAIGAFLVWLATGGDIQYGDIFLTDLMSAATPVMMMVVLSTFLGLWFGVWLALHVLHKQKLRSLFAPEGRIRWREFGAGFLVIAVYLGFGIAASVLTGAAPYRSDLPIATWAMYAVPVSALVYMQSVGEELAFRGYFVQQLGARFRSAIVWGLLPALVFGLGHFTNTESLDFAYYYVAATTLFGVIAAATIWRTGSLAAAMGMHVGNNLMAFLVAGPDDAMASTQLWLWPVEEMVSVSWLDLSALALLLAYVVSPWAPFPRETALFGRRKNEIRAAP